MDEKILVLYSIDGVEDYILIKLIYRKVSVKTKWTVLVS